MKAESQFNRDKVEELIDFISEAIKATDCHLVEVVYALSSVLRSLGEHFYDKDDVSYEAVLADYKESPSFPGALILHAEGLPKIYELFTKSSRNSNE